LIPFHVLDAPNGDDDDSQPLDWLSRAASEECFINSLKEMRYILFDKIRNILCVNLINGTAASPEGVCMRGLNA